MAQLRTASPQTPLTPRRWTRREYDHLVALGMFDDEPLELLGRPAHRRRTAARLSCLGGDAPNDEGHPARVALAVEVADARLAFDREHKAGLYARAGIADYWIVNLGERQLEVHRASGPEPLARFGWRYRSVTALEPPARVAPLAFPAAHVAVADLLPRRAS